MVLVVGVAVLLIGQATEAWAAAGGIAEVKSFATKLTGYVTAIAASVAILFMAINGLRWTMSSGNSMRQAEARNGLVAAAAGLAIALSAGVIVNLVMAALNLTSTTGLDPVVQVPVDLETDEPLAGPVTFRMAGWLALAGAGVAALAFSHGAVLLLGAGVLLLMVGVACAFVRPAGRPLAAWLLPLLGYRQRTRAVRRSRRD